MLIDPSSLDALQELMGGDQDDLNELIADFIEEAPLLLGRIKDGTQSGDFDAVRIAAHTLKSNARDLGAVLLGSQAAEFEAATKTPNLPHISQVAPLEQTLTLSVSELERMLKY